MPPAPSVLSPSFLLNTLHQFHAFYLFEIQYPHPQPQNFKTYRFRDLEIIVCCQAASIPFTLFDALTRSWPLPYSWISCRFVGRLNINNNLVNPAACQPDQDVPVRGGLHVLADHRVRGAGQVPLHRPVRQDSGGELWLLSALHSNQLSSFFFVSLIVNCAQLLRCAN